MWDLGMHPSLTAIAVDDLEMLHLLTLMFGGIVGIAAALVALEVLWFHWFRHDNSEVSLGSKSCVTCPSRLWRSYLYGVPGAKRLLRDTRDVPYTYKGESAVLPQVTGDFCAACDESVLDASESRRTMSLMWASNKQVNASIVDPEFIVSVPL